MGIRPTGSRGSATGAGRAARRRRRVAAAAALSSIGAVGLVGLAPASGGVAAAAPPTPVVGLLPTGGIVRFDASRPDAFGAPTTITGLTPGELIVGIDVRPVTGELVGIGVQGATGRIYVIDPISGAATMIGAAPFSTSLPTGGSWAVDFNPTVDRIRAVHSSGLNLRLNPVDGTLAATDVAVTGGTVSALAYDRSVVGGNATTLYVLDAATDRLSTMGSVNSAPQSPNAGVLNTVGPLGADVSEPVTLDIAPSASAFAGTALSTMDVAGAPVLATIDLRSGAATVQGPLDERLRDLAVLAPTPVVALTGSGQLVRFDAGSPEVVSPAVNVGGLQPGEVIVGIDARPATGQLIGVGVVGGAGRLYVIDPASGAATQIGTTPFSTALPAGGSWTVDVNPTVDRIRLVHSTGLNLRLNPLNGALAATDTPITGGTLAAGAYDRTVASATATTLYGLDVDADALVTVGGLDGVPSPNGGLLVPVGPLGVDASGAAGFDIAPSSAPRGRALASLEVGGATALHHVDLVTGAVTAVGPIGSGSVAVRDLAVVPAVVPGASQYAPVTPTRLLDTRETGSKPAAGGIVEVQVTGAVVPAGATAVVLNVVGTEATADGYVTVFPSGEARPTAANQNLTTGMTRGNLVTVKIGAGGRVSIFTQSGAHLVVDVFGYYAPATSTAGRFTPLAPARLVDTRQTAKVAPGGSIDVQVTGAGGVPATGVSAVVVNVTAVEATAAGFVTGHASGTPRPFTATLNVERAGQTIGNLAVLPVGANGAITLYSQSGTHLVVDVAGWYADATSRGGTSGLFVPISPSRLLDTRVPPAAALPANGSVDVTFAGVLGIPSARVAGVVVNLTAVGVDAPGFVTMYPAGATRQEVSSLYADTLDQIIPSLVVSQLGTGGRASVFSNAGTDLVIDVAGWFTA